MTRIFGLFCLGLWVFAQAAYAQSGDAEFVGSSTCADCHEEEYALWQNSHHALAWTEATPDNIKADFSDRMFEHDGVAYAFSTSNGDASVRITEADGAVRDYGIHSVVGIEPLQQYLLETEEGGLQSFDVVWDRQEEEWYHLYPDQNLPPDDGLHWSGPYKNWNARCAECHATDYSRNYDVQTQTHAPEMTEKGVGYEACHGPGSLHLELVSGKSPQLAAGLTPYGFTDRLNMPDQDAAQCAGCHSRRDVLGDGNPLPGTPYHDVYNLAVLRPGLYHADGQILDEVYVYGSFLQSKMYSKGVTCGDCHEPHAAQVIAGDNSLCTQCHSPAGNARFPSLRLTVYDDVSHTHHPEGSEGAQCKSCHMIERNYMGIDGRRDHSFRIPRPDLSVELGTPNACSDCHTDRSPDWAADQVVEWFPNSPNRGAHFGQVLHAAQIEPIAAAGSLIDLALNAENPGIVRATALYLLRPAVTVDAIEQLVDLRRDPDPLVRANLAPLLRPLAPEQRMRAMRPLLTDPMRNVRVEAAKQMLDISPQSLGASSAAILARAMTEWRTTITNRLDFPETHLVLGGTALTLRNFGAARDAFRQVVSMDPQRVEAWDMLIRLAAAIDGNDSARLVLEEALDVLPDDPSLNAIAAQFQ